MVGIWVCECFNKQQKAAAERKVFVVSVVDKEGRW